MADDAPITPAEAAAALRSGAVRLDSHALELPEKALLTLVQRVMELERLPPGAKPPNELWTGELWSDEPDQAERETERHRVAPNKPGQRRYAAAVPLMLLLTGLAVLAACKRNGGELLA